MSKKNQHDDIQKYFDAAKELKSPIAIDEINQLINNPTVKRRPDSSIYDFLTNKKIIIMITTLGLITAGVLLWNSESPNQTQRMEEQININTSPVQLKEVDLGITNTLNKKVTLLDWFALEKRTNPPVNEKEVKNEKKASKSIKNSNQPAEKTHGNIELIELSDKELKKIGIEVTDEGISYNEDIDGLGNLKFFINGGQYGAQFSANASTSSKRDYYPMFVTDKSGKQILNYEVSSNDNDPIAFQKVIKGLVPIKVGGNKNLSYPNDLVFWFKPSLEFLKILPYQKGIASGEYVSYIFDITFKARFTPGEGGVIEVTKKLSEFEIDRKVFPILSTDTIIIGATSWKKIKRYIKSFNLNKDKMQVSFDKHLISTQSMKKAGLVEMDAKDYEIEYHVSSEAMYCEEGTLEQIILGNDRLMQPVLDYLCDNNIKSRGSEYLKYFITGEKPESLIDTIADTTFKAADYRVATNQSNDNVVISPNPYHDGNLRLDVQLEEQEIVNVKLIDIEGRLVKNLVEDKVMNEGSNTLNISLGKQTPGLYNIYIEYKNQEPTSHRLLIR